MGYGPIFIFYYNNENNMGQERLTEEREFYKASIVELSENRRDEFKQYYEAQATLNKVNALDTFRQFLIEQGMTSLNVEDMWVAFLTGEGYSGHVKDMERKYYIDNS